MKARLIPLIVADLYQLAGEFRDAGEAIARGIGQSQARWQVLSAASAEPRTVPQIARRLGVSRQAVQRLADMLVAEHLAAYAPNPDHRNSPHLLLAGTGRAALATLTRAAAASHARLAQRFKEEELAALHAGLRRLLAVLDQEEE